MGKSYCVDLFVSTPRRWMGKYNFSQKENRLGIYYSIMIDECTKNKILCKARKSHIKYRCYEKRWDRSAGYRKHFLAAFPGPYRCRYCNRRIDQEHMVVDHIVPVNKAKTSAQIRFFMEIAGIYDVNDFRNLAASCKICNKRKADKTGIWILRGILGRYKAYWLIVYLCGFLLTALAIFSLITTRFPMNLVNIF